MSGNATQAQISSFLTALRMKGETIDEITACATVMRDKAVKLSPPFPVMDIVGTGGDEVGTFNISTTSALRDSTIITPNASAPAATCTASSAASGRCPFRSTPRP